MLALRRGPCHLSTWQCSGLTPDHAAPTCVTPRRAAQGFYEFPEDVALSESARGLVHALLVVDPSQRPSLEQVRQHAFFAEHIGPLALAAMRDGPGSAAAFTTASGDDVQQQQQQHSTGLGTAGVAFSVVGHPHRHAAHTHRAEANAWSPAGTSGAGSRGPVQLQQLVEGEEDEDAGTGESASNSGHMPRPHSVASGGALTDAHRPPPLQPLPSFNDGHSGPETDLTPPSPFGHLGMASSVGAVDLRLLLCDAGLAAVAAAASGMDRGGGGHRRRQRSSGSGYSTSGSYLDLSASEQYSSVATALTGTLTEGGEALATVNSQRSSQGQHHSRTGNLASLRQANATHAGHLGRGTGQVELQESEAGHGGGKDRPHKRRHRPEHLRRARSQSHQAVAATEHVPGSGRQEDEEGEGQHPPGDYMRDHRTGKDAAPASSHAGAGSHGAPILARHSLPARTLSHASTFTADTGVSNGGRGAGGGSGVVVRAHNAFAVPAEPSRSGEGGSGAPEDGGRLASAATGSSGVLQVGYSSECLATAALLEDVAGAAASGARASPGPHHARVPMPVPVLVRVQDELAWQTGPGNSTSLSLNPGVSSLGVQPNSHTHQHQFYFHRPPSTGHMQVRMRQCQDSASACNALGCASGGLRGLGYGRGKGVCLWSLLSKRALSARCPVGVGIPWENVHGGQ